MKRIITRIFFFSLLLGLFLVAYYRRFETNFSDRFYRKFTNPPASMVLGSSRALLGLDPESIQKTYPAKEPFLNFAFTQKTSPYGEVYYNAVVKKIGDDVTGGLYILEVSPLNISGDSRELPEENLVLNDQYFFNLDPNFEYVAKNNEHPLFFDMLPHVPKKPIQFPHANGWLENLDERRDSAAYAKKILKQEKEYRDVLNKFSVQEYRLSWLEKTIVYLARHGKVVILRMPVTERMRQMENKYCPGFNKMMEDLAQKTHAHYINMHESEGYSFSDLHHMSSSSARLFSEQVGNEAAKIK